jgi:hypothetical protein
VMSAPDCKSEGFQGPEFCVLRYNGGYLDHEDEGPGLGVFQLVAPLPSRLLLKVRMGEGSRDE